MVSRIAASTLEYLDRKCEDFGGNSLRQTLFAGAGLVAANGATFVATSLESCYPTIFALAMIVNVVCIATLAKNAFQWRNVLIFLLGMTVLTYFGIHWHSESGGRLYKEKKCKDWGELTYCVDSKGNEHPVVTLYTEEPKKIGYVYGNLTGRGQVYAYKKGFPPLEKLAQMLTGDTRAEWLDRTLRHVTIPEKYREKIQGFMEGVNDWCAAKGDPFRLTVHDVLRMHCFTDTYKIGNESILRYAPLKYLWNTIFGDMGCSTVVFKRGHRMMICRNMDYPGFQVGQFHFFSKTYKPNGEMILSHQFPGFVVTDNATLYKDNQMILSVIANECPVRTDTGLPCGIWLSELLEQCSTMTDVEKFVKESDRVASSFNLIVADGRTACNYQMHPDAETYYLKRELSKTGSMVVVNHFIDPETEQVYGSAPPAGTSGLRHADITRHIKASPSGTSLSILASRCLKLKSTNRPVTLYSEIKDFDCTEGGVVCVSSNAWSASKLSLSNRSSATG